MEAKILVRIMSEALRSYDGKFSDSDLQEALSKMFQYPYTSDSESSKEEWEEYFK